MSPERKGRELVENFLNAPGGKISRFQAMNFAKFSIGCIVQAITITTDHCTLNHLDRAECNSDVEFWSDVIAWIDSALSDTDPDCDYPDPVKYLTHSFIYNPAAADFENWLAKMSDSGVDVVQVLSTVEESDFGVSGRVKSIVLFKWRVV